MRTRILVQGISQKSPSVSSSSGVQKWDVTPPFRLPSILSTQTSKAGPSFFSSKFKYWGLGYQVETNGFCFYSADSTVFKVESKNWTFSCLVSLLLFAGLQYMVDNLDKMCIVRIEGKDFAFSHPPPPPAHHCSFPSCCIVQEGWGQVQDGNRACILSEVKGMLDEKYSQNLSHALLPPQSSDHSCPCHSQLLPLLPPFCTELLDIARWRSLEQWVLFLLRIWSIFFDDLMYLL